MKYFTYLVVSIMILAVLSLFYLKKPDGQAWLSISSMSEQSLQISSQLLSKSSNTFHQALTSVKQASDSLASSIYNDTANKEIANNKIYKWQDNNGQWHYADSPNPDGDSIEFILDPKHITVVKAEDTSILNSSSSTNTGALDLHIPHVITPESIDKLVNDAESVEHKLEQRNKEINNLSLL